jgi:hypothetical protein
VPVSVLINPASDKVLLSLSYRNMGLRERTIERPASETCWWPPSHSNYQAWLTRSNVDQRRGLLRLMGHPGSGKSVLVKALASACAIHAECSENQVASFFFDARGSSEQKSILGFLKTVLFQLLPICAKTHSYFNNLYNLEVDRDDEEGAIDWHVGDLRDVLLRFCSVKRNTPIYIFIDAMDECGDNKDARSFANFLQELADTSYDANSKVNICISSRWYPTVTIRYCAEILVDIMNRKDIERYVSRELHQYRFIPSEMHKIKDILTSKAEGIFLWARLVLSSVVRAFDAGFNLDLSSFLSYLAELPKPLDELFDRILGKFSSQQRVHALRLFQWAVLAQRPLSADEWIHILAFVIEPNLHSIKAWREGKYGVRNMEQLAKRLRNMTGGLLEVVLQDFSQEDNHSEVVSSTGSARAGSMEPYGPATFVVQFMHLSACQYFLTGNGFKSLGQAAPPACFGDGHIYIAEICLCYTRLDEIKPLIGDTAVRRLLRGSSESESTRAKRVTRRRIGSGTNLSMVSFGSSAASSVRRSSLPASAPASISGNDKPAEFFGESHGQLTRELLETHTHALKSDGDDPEDDPENEPEEDAHHHYEQLENSRPGPFLTNSCGSFSASSIDAVVLNDPALRLYAVEMFVHHVVAANQVDADPSDLLSMLHSSQALGVVNGCWDMWCKLNDREGLWPDTTPAYFAGEWNLWTWIKWYHRYLPSFLIKRSGGMRYPLLAAIIQGNKSIMALLSDHFNTDDIVKDAWMMLHYLAECSVSANEAFTTRPIHQSALARHRFTYSLTERLLTLSTGILTEDSDIALRSRLGNYMTKSHIGGAEFEDMLVGILSLTSLDTESSVDTSRQDRIDSFLNDAFLRIRC